MLFVLVTIAMLEQRHESSILQTSWRPHHSLIGD